MKAKVKSFLLAAFLGITALNGLAQPGTDSITRAPRGAAGKAALKGRWYLQPVLTSDSSTGKVAEIVFDPRTGLFTGNTGCNTMRGRFTASDSAITFGADVVTTKMTCPGYNEPAFLKNLLRVSSYSIQNGMLILMVDGQELMRWARKKPVAPKTGTA